MAEAKGDRRGGTSAAERMIAQDCFLAETDTLRVEGGGPCVPRILKQALAGMIGLKALFSLLFLAFTLAIGDPILIVLTSLLFLSLAYYLAAFFASMKSLRSDSSDRMARINWIQRRENFLKEVAVEKAPWLLKNPERTAGYRERDGRTTRNEEYAIVTPKGARAPGLQRQPTALNLRIGLQLNSRDGRARVCFDQVKFSLNHS